MAAAAPAAAAPRGSVEALPESETRSRTELGESEAGEEAFNVMTLKLAALEVIAPVEEEAEASPEAAMGEPRDELTSHAGIAVSFERTVIPGWLALEVNVLLSPGEGGLTLPAELLVKKPFELSAALEPFVGVGLATEWLVAGEYEPQYGLASELGAYYWLDPGVGLVLETEYSLLLSRETEHEFTLAAGGALRF